MGRTKEKMMELTMGKDFATFFMTDEEYAQREEEREDNIFRHREYGN